VITHLSHQEEEEVDQKLHAHLQLFGQEEVLQAPANTRESISTKQLDASSKSSPGFVRAREHRTGVVNLLKVDRAQAKLKTQGSAARRSKRSSNARETQRVPLGFGLITGGGPC